MMDISNSLHVWGGGGGVILHAFLSSVDFFFKYLLKIKSFRSIPSEFQTVWIQITPVVLLGLIWVQTVYKGYQQTTKVATSWGKS